MELQSEFDVVIVGGGMVGAAQALAFCQQQKRVLLIEMHLPESSSLQKPPLRVSAVNLFSQDYLTDLGIWPHIAPSSMCVFNHLSTWEKNSVTQSTDKDSVSPETGREVPKHQRVTFSAPDIGKSHLGYLIRNEALQLAAYKQFEQLENPPVIVNADIEMITQSESLVSMSLVLEDEQRDTKRHKQKNVTTKLLVGADGANSKVRQLANIGLSGWDYQQHCLSITIKTEFPAQDITWQEFQPSGPKAFLPLNEGYSSLIWYDAPERIKQIKQLSNDGVKQQVLQTFPKLAGDFDVVQLASFPLTRRQANQYVSGRIVLVGDAAHTINPLAGQGVNLGYKDVMELTSQLDAVDFSIENDQALKKALATYERKRKAESLIMSGAMDSFYTLFSNDKTPLKMLRTGLLSVANKFEFAKKLVLKKAVGY